MKEYEYRFVSIYGDDDAKITAKLKKEMEALGFRLGGWELVSHSTTFSKGGCRCNTFLLRRMIGAQDQLNEG